MSKIILYQWLVQQVFRGILKYVIFVIGLTQRLIDCNFNAYNWLWYTLKNLIKYIKRIIKLNISSKLFLNNPNINVVIHSC